MWPASMSRGVPLAFSTATELPCTSAVTWSANALTSSRQMRAGAVSNPDGRACRAVASGRRAYRASWFGRDGCRETYVQTAPHAVGRRARREGRLRADAHGDGGDAHPAVGGHRDAENGGELRPRVALHEHEVTERLHDWLPPGPHPRLQPGGE